MLIKLVLLLLFLLFINNVVSFNINNIGIRKLNTNIIRLNELIIKKKQERLATTIDISNNDSLSRCDKYANKIRNQFNWGIIGTIVRYINILFVSLIMGFFFRVLNNMKIFNGELLWKYLFKRENKRPLLTVSNHISMLDDPGLMGALLPYWRFKPDQVRWGICTEDFFFTAGGKLAPLFAGGNVYPLDRSGSLEQPMFKLFQEKLSEGSWCHVFAEGRIWQSWRFEGDETRLGPFKIGVGKLIAHSKLSPIIVPMYHKGMDNVIPEKQFKDIKSKKPSKPISSIPRIGNKIEVYYGESFDFTNKIEEFKKKYPGMLDQWTSTAETIQLYTEIANECREKVKILARKAYGQSYAPKFEG